MKKNILGLLIVVLAGGATSWYLWKYRKSKGPGGSHHAGQSNPDGKQNEFGIKMEDLKPGDGDAIEFGDTVEVHYVGMLGDGKKFDSTRDRGQPMRFLVGANQILQGIDMGVVGMKLSGIRRLTVPPQFGYGDKGAGGGLVPTKATLIYEVELLKLEKKKAKKAK
jgi:FKBP-type peptidyl-prolyl cis-trans isomerase